MIPAIQQQHRQERSRSAANVAGIGMPSFRAVLDIVQSAPISSPKACTPATTPQAAPIQAAPAPTDFTQFIGRSVGSGQCVALVRAADPGLGLAATWSPGAPVQGNTSLQPGTPIATFTAGRYANATDGSSHAALYLGQNADGVQVLDQWVGSAAAIRTIPWQNPSGTPANTGAAFRVIARS